MYKRDNSGAVFPLLPGSSDVLLPNLGLWEAYFVNFQLGQHMGLPRVPKPSASTKAGPKVPLGAARKFLLWQLGESG